MTQANALQANAKVALITGAAQRIGRVFALGLVEDGWAVAVHYNKSRAAAQKLVQTIMAQGGRALSIQADLTQTRARTPLFAKITRGLGAPTLLLNNASQFVPDDIRTLTPRSWQTHIATNLEAPLFLCQAFARQLPARRQGNIVNMLDQRVWNLAPDFLSYTVSKVGLWTLTQTLAQALAPRIRVNGIGPGPSLASKRQSSKGFQAQQRKTLLQRGAPPEELLAGLRYILATPSLTGQMLALDGGQHLQGGVRAE